TGVIGRPLPIERILTAVPTLTNKLSSSGLSQFAEAILTTDKGPKFAAVRRSVGKQVVTVAGVTKGAGMIAPNMATTLSFLVADAPVDRVYLRAVLREEVEATLNCVTIDGDTSTNDACFLLSSSASDLPPIRGDDRAGKVFRQMVRDVLKS